MDISKEELVVLFEKELQKYSKDKNAFKDYFSSMKELSAWLASMEK